MKKETGSSTKETFKTPIRNYEIRLERNQSVRDKLDVQNTVREMYFQQNWLQPLEKMDKKEEKHGTFEETMEGPTLPSGLEKRHYAYPFKVHDDDDDQYIP